MRISYFPFFVIFLFLVVPEIKGTVRGLTDYQSEIKYSLQISESRSKSEPKLDFAGTNAINIQTVTGNATIFEDLKAELTLEQDIEETLATFRYVIDNKFKYQFSIGQIRNFELVYSSGSQVNKLTEKDPGIVYGVGFGGNITPGSIVSSAINWDLSFIQRLIHLNRLNAGSSNFLVNQSIRQEEISFGLEVSRRLSWGEPYAGVKLTRINTEIKDSSSASEVKGRQEIASPFIGINVSFKNKKMFFLEASFVGDESYGGGVNIEFE